MSWLKYLVPYRGIGGSGAEVFGIDVFGGDRKPWADAIVMGLYHFFHRIDAAIWWFKWRYVRRHQYNIVRTGLEPGYYDEDTRMLHACMALLCQFVEWYGGVDALDSFTAELRGNPDPDAPISANGQINIQSEAAAIYRWWKFERPANRKRHDEMINRLYGGGEMITREVEIGGEIMHEIVGFEHDENRRLPGDSSEALWELDRQNDADDQAMLHRLINIRHGLWT